jgi:arabinan endo-1,5-alpha-L-arabinosidase
MTGERVDAPDESLILASKDASIPFSVSVRLCTPLSSILSIRVRGPEPRSGSILTREYDVMRGARLTAATHTAYLDLFEALARDFGMRMPTNRCRIFPSDFSAPLRPLLTENLTSEILYGYGDPSALRVVEKERGPEPFYYVITTSGDAPQSFPVLRSRDLRVWELTGFVFPGGKKPRWAAEVERGGEYWAPELNQVGGQFAVLFASREKDLSLAVGLAQSISPIGPFVPSEQPLIRGGVIDPHMFIDRDGSATLFWKADNNDIWPSLLSQLLHNRPELIGDLFISGKDRRTACFNALLWPWIRTLHPMERFFVQQILIQTVVSNFSHFRARLKRMIQSRCKLALAAELTDLLKAMRTVIYGQRLDIERWTLQGEPSVVLQNDLEWEGHLVEGVSMMRRYGKYYVFYSGNDFSTAQYGIGVGVGDSPTGPFKKKQQPFLRSTAEWWGPGHPSVVPCGPDGRPWLLFHAYRNGHVGYKQFRALLGVPLTFVGDEVTAG